MEPLKKFQLKHYHLLLFQWVESMVMVMAMTIVAMVMVAMVMVAMTVLSTQLQQIHHVQVIQSVTLTVLRTMKLLVRQWY